MNQHQNRILFTAILMWLTILACGSESAAPAATNGSQATLPPAATLTPTPEPSPTATLAPIPLPEGWLRIEVADKGFAIGLPPGLQQLVPDTAEFQAAHDAHPPLAPMLDAIAEDFASGADLYFALELSDEGLADGYPTNIVIARVEMAEPRSLDVAASGYGAALQKHVGVVIGQERITFLPAGDAEKYSYPNTVGIGPQSQALDLSVRQYFLVHGKFAYAIICTSLLSDINVFEPLFDQVAQTFEFIGE